MDALSGSSMFENREMGVWGKSVHVAVLHTALASVRHALLGND